MVMVIVIAIIIVAIVVAMFREVILTSCTPIASGESRRCHLGPEGVDLIALWKESMSTTPLCCWSQGPQEGCSGILEVSMYQVVLFKLSISTVYQAEVVSAGGFLGDA